MVKICKECGAENSDSFKFCEKCGKELESSSEVIKTTPKKDNKKTLIILAAIVVVLAVVIIGASLIAPSQSSIDTPTDSNYASSVPTVGKINTVTQDFGGITMQVPEGSNFVQTMLSARSGSVGGFASYENKGQHSNEAYSLMISALKNVDPPSQFVYEKTDGDVKIYKNVDANSDLCFMEKKVGDYTFSLMGRDQSLMKDMLNSVQVNNPTLNI